MYYQKGTTLSGMMQEGEATVVDKIHTHDKLAFEALDYIL